jgi:hypothetical protein
MINLILGWVGFDFKNQLPIKGREPLAPTVKTKPNSYIRNKFVIRIPPINMIS